MGSQLPYCSMGSLTQVTESVSDTVTEWSRLEGRKEGGFVRASPGPTPYPDEGWKDGFLVWGVVGEGTSSRKSDRGGGTVRMTVPKEDTVKRTKVSKEDSDLKRDFGKSLIPWLICELVFFLRSKRSMFTTLEIDR